MAAGATGNSRRHLTITMELPSVAALFEPPALTPLSDAYHPYSYESGMEYLAYLIYADRRINTVEATFVLPQDEVERVSHDDVQAAIQRFTAAKIEASSIEVRADATRGRRALLLGVVALVALLLVAHWVYRTWDSGYITNTVITGLQVGAWVALWFPADKLVWSAWTHRNDRVVYQRLAEIDFTLASQTNT